MTHTHHPNRDYSLAGSESGRAIEAGLADGKWFQADIDQRRLTELSARSNGRAAFDMSLWIALLIASGVLAWNVRATWWAFPAFAAYGALYGGAADPRWHECGHGTAFKSNRLNDLIYFPASFMLARQPLFWRWSHFRHHTDTIIRGRDAEIVHTRPPSVLRTVAKYSHIHGGLSLMGGTVRTATGHITDVDRELIPEHDHPRLVRHARVTTSIWIAAIVAALATRTIWPVLYVGGPTIYGAWLLMFFGLTQHAGLQENVLDHRYSTRTVLMNPIFRFLYLNMNYHVEHHMYPTVPYYRLPQLHEEIKDQLAPPSPSMRHAYREIFAALKKLSVDPDWEIPDRQIPHVKGRQARIVQVASRPNNGGPANLGPANLAPGDMRPVRLDGVDYVVARTEDGSHMLIDRMCTHGDADLSSGLILGCEIECPKHNGRFSLLTGEPTRKPVRQPIAAQPIIAEGGYLYLDE